MNGIHAHQAGRHPRPLVLGMLAFAVCGLALWFAPAHLGAAVLFAMALAVLAGRARALADDFFAGLALALAGWGGAGLVLGSPAQRFSTLMLLPEVFLLTFILGSMGFFLGVCLRRRP
ncbi:hypothetical protein [Massilia sp. IC2-476]|uniref:hypothetical protein n=1 Tax=Massilia sp. IC2-476 TaxID=2887199 RepID=UPI001D10A535|nr:hypothetical protein [Massilia sp. IC2-476]MCC2972019.1 hypothetical protein [Massilia sp. IC2-476]